MQRPLNMRRCKLEELRERIREKRSILVAYSGGVDSSLLAKVASDALGERALAVILDSETMPQRELQQAAALAQYLGISCRIAEFSVLGVEEFRQNPAERCYICKKRSIAILKNIAAEEGIICIADGLNASDLQDWRPGNVASDEEGIWHPFVDMGMTKEDIRALARDLGLSVWNKPSSACLASRIAYGQIITQELLAMVEEAEDYLKGLGFGQLRVRAEGRSARIELERRDMVRATEIGEEIAARLKGVGFDYVSLDLQGYRCGSMNEVLWTSRE
jgi:pyridinium-3,5-biscarboxylic acid mononucleotide sulfurtransferase